MAVAVAVAVMPAAAQATSREFGEMVDHVITLPVDGEHHLWDTFWAARSNETGVHHAQDIMADKMTPVVAAASGTIRLVNWSSRPDDLNPERCCTIVLRHDDGWESWYIHLNNDTPGTDDGKGWGIAEGIVPGVHVDAGQLIGWVGDSGNAESTAPHVHFELRDPAGVVVNPYAALRAAGANAPAPSDAVLAGVRVLRQGMRGADVERLQQLLAAEGLDPGPVDGIFGRRTDRAVRAFQRDHGLTVDGIVGSATRGALRRVAPAEGPVFDRILRKGSIGNDVRAVQSMLKAAGFDPGPVDAVFGGKTLLAVLAFQEANGLSVDGLVGPKTLAALGA